MVLETVATGLRSARTGATGERALVLARSLIDLAASSPVAGTTSGQTAGALTWTTQTRPLATAQIRPPGGGAGETPPSVTLFVIETRVHWTGGGEVVLTTERLAAGTGAAP